MQEVSQADAGEELGADAVGDREELRPEELLRLLASPRDIPILAPLVEREILYRMLTGDQGRMLRQIALTGGKLGQVNRAISWIKRLRG